MAPGIARIDEDIRQIVRAREALTEDLDRLRIRAGQKIKMMNPLIQLQRHPWLIGVALLAGYAYRRFSK